ncbi:MAG: glycosyltransferase family 2 protein, partial [Candidatus Methanospirareceae archaeon]
LLEYLIPDEVFEQLNARVIESGGTGLSRARNRGVEASTGDVLVFMDDDILISDANLLFRVREAFGKDEKLGVYGVQVKPLFYNSVKLPDKFNWIFGCTDNNAVRPVGAFFATRREIFNIVGLFDENLGRKGNLISGEETELFIRVQKFIGLKVVLDNRYRVYHLIHNRRWKYVLKRAFAEGISKARFKNYDMSVEKKYLFRYLKDPIGWVVVGATGLGYFIRRMKQ